MHIKGCSEQTKIVIAMCFAMFYIKLFEHNQELQTHYY